MATIGLQNFVYAIMTNETTEVYGTPVSVKGISSAKINPKTATGELAGDDIIRETATVFAGADFEVELNNLTIEDRAALTGQTCTLGVIKEDATKLPPYVAIGFKSKKSNSKFVYVWLYKGKFEVVGDEFKTSDGKSVNFSTPKLKGNFIARQKDNNWKASADEEGTGFVATTATSWFTKVYGEA